MAAAAAAAPHSTLLALEQVALAVVAGVLHLRLALLQRLAQRTPVEAGAQVVTFSRMELPRMTQGGPSGLERPAALASS
jgi:hypothetical protein